MLKGSRVPVLILSLLCLAATQLLAQERDFQAIGQIRTVVSEAPSNVRPKLPFPLAGNVTSRIDHYFVVSTPNSSERWIALNGEHELTSYVGRTVRVTGKLVGNRLIPVRIDSYGPTDNGGGPPPTIGSYKTVAVPLTISPTQPDEYQKKTELGEVTPEAIRDVLFNLPDSVNNFYREASYGEFGFTGVHHPQADVVPVAIQATIGGNCQEQIITEFTPFVRQRLLEQGIDTFNGSVDLGIIIFNNVVGCPPYPIATRGPLGQRGLPLWLWMPESWFVTGPKIMTHEIGHALGGNHPFAMSCTNFDDPQSCVVYEAADRDFMAAGGIHQYMPNNYERRRWGWYRPGAFDTPDLVNSFIDLRSAVLPLGKSSPKRDQFYYRSLAAPHGGWDIYPEARQNYNVFERYIAADDDFRRGVSVRIGHSNYGDPDALSILVDTTLSPGLEDAPLTEGEQLNIGGTQIRCVADHAAVRGTRVSVNNAQVPGSQRP